MVEKLIQYISDQGLLSEGDRVLVAASAGIDSTVLCYLLKKIEVDFAVAHCNFRLRGKESDGDESFIKNLAKDLGAPFYSINFDTEKYASAHGKSIQLAARDLRYEWLWKICHEKGYQKLATAHHLDDNIETVLFNFSKATGIKGMRGILPKRNGLIRPILFATKKEVLKYAKEHEITFRADRSNASDQYTRNKIRHQVIPVLESINPSFQQSAGETIKHLREIEDLYNYAIHQLSVQLMEAAKDQYGNVILWKIDTLKLMASPASATVIYEILQPFGFNHFQTDQILQSIDNQPGSFFYSPQYRLLVDRGHLILEEKNDLVESVQIEALQVNKVLEIPGGKLIFKEMGADMITFPKSKNVAFFDKEKLIWPLTLRRWSGGDVFKPMGMGGKRKKIQDYFTNEKLSRSEKEKAWIMETGGNVCWVVGMRLDERYKVTTETIRCLVVEFLPSTFVD